MEPGMTACLFLLMFSIAGIGAQFPPRPQMMPDPPLQRRPTRANFPFRPMVRSMNPRAKVSQLDKLATTSVLMGSDSMKRHALNRYIDHRCVRNRPFLKAFIMDALDYPAFLAARRGNLGRMALTFPQLPDQVKKMTMLQELQAPCVRGEQGLSVLLSDASDLPLPFGMAGLGRMGLGMGSSRLGK